MPRDHVVIEVDDDSAFAWVPTLRAALQRAATDEMRVYVVARARDR